jgi:thioesterase domain-containing protein
MFSAIAASGQAGMAVNLLASASAMPADRRVRPAAAPVRLGADEPAEPADGPMLICVPSVGPAGAAEFLGFARAAGQPVTVLPLPGFDVRAYRPESFGELVEHLAEATRLAAGNRPFVLIGRSSGGLLAHALTELLERRHHAPDGLVLLDTYERDLMFSEDWLASLIVTALDRLLDHLDPDAQRDALLTVGTYLRLLHGRPPAPLRTRSLLLAAADPVPGMPADGWRATRSVPHDRVEVPGDHFTMLDQHAAETAGALSRWLAAQPTGTRRA